MAGLESRTYIRTHTRIPTRTHRRTYALSAASASIVIAPPPVSLWARRIQNGQYPGEDLVRAASSSSCSSSSNDDDNNNTDNNTNNANHHLRADSSVLGYEQPRILTRAHVAAPIRPPPPPPSPPPPPPPPPQRSPSSVYSTDRLLLAVPSPPTTPYAISSPIGAPFYPRPEDYGGYRSPPRPQRYSAQMPLEMLPRAHWLSRLRSCLRLLIIVLSAGVVSMLLHTLGIYRGNRYLELRKGEIPMVWPAHTNLAPTIVLAAVAGANFLASVAILSLSFKRAFRRPIRSRDVYRVVAGALGVVLWAAALIVYRLLDRASKASLGRYSCANASRITNGRFQYRAVCEEQNVAFYTAVGAAGAELLTLLTLAASAIRSMRDEPPLPTIQIHEKTHSTHRSSGWKPSRPKTWIQ